MPVSVRIWIRNLDRKCCCKLSMFKLEYPKPGLTLIVCLVFMINVSIVTVVLILIQTKDILSSNENRGNQLMQINDAWGHMDIEPQTTALPTIPISTSDNDPPLPFLSLLKPVAHVSGLDFHNGMKEENSIMTIRNWALSEGSERILLYNGMEYEDGTIVIPATGIYCLYTHVKFYVEDNKRGGDNDNFIHEVIRYNAITMKNETLFSNKVSECTEGINNGAHLEYPSDLRGIVQLSVGDRISVSVSDFSLLRHDRDWHYFGSYMI